MITATLRTPGAEAPTAATGPVVDVQSEVIPEGQSTENALFGGDPGTPIPTTPVTAVTPTPPSGPVERYRSEDTDEDGFGQSDLKFPALRVVQGSGKLSQLHNVGTLALGTDIENLTVLAEPPKAKEDGFAIRFIPVKLKKQWREVLTQEESAEGNMARIVDTIEEVEALGGTTQWVGESKPSWRPSARCLILIEKPEGVDDPQFSQELDGKLYCPAVFYASNSAYGAFAQIIFNTARISLLEPVLDGQGQPTKSTNGAIIKKPCYPKNIWTLSVAKRPSGDFTIFVPKPKLVAKELTGPEARAFCDQLTQVASAAVKPE